MFCGLASSGWIGDPASGYLYAVVTLAKAVDVPTCITSILFISMHASLLNLQHLAPVAGGFLQLLSTRGVGQVLEMNTLPFPQELLSTKVCWEMVAKEPISLLFQ